MQMLSENDCKENWNLILKLIILCALITVVTGCAGVELGGKLGLYRVDEKQDSSATVQAQTKPLKCYLGNFEGCGEARGS